MAANDFILAGAALLFAGLLFQPKLLGSPLWRATVTPLASIIGSGFLVAGPILAHVAGHWAWLAMMALCAVGYLFGAVIRHNIAYVELELASHPGRLVQGLEGASGLALSAAYFVSVAYYLNLFAAFGLRLGAIIDPGWIRIAATVVIAAVGIIGAFGGLKALERVEVGAVALKLSVIGGLLVVLTVASALALRGGTFVWPTVSHPSGAHELAVLLGLVILVQGFETSRYLGQAYDPQTRIRTMSWAQWISTGIYLGFMVLITPYFSGRLPAVGGETGIIDMLRPVGALVAPLLILAALASQLSAAVADTNGAAGLLSESTGRRIAVGMGNLLVATAAIAITWMADIYEIIAIASKMFVAYYGLQSIQAALSAVRSSQYGRAAVFALGVLVALAVILFAVPAAA